MIIKHNDVEWNAEFINPQIEPSFNAYTLILSSSLGAFRINKCFKSNINVSSDLFLQEAQKEISIIELELSKENI